MVSKQSYRFFFQAEDGIRDLTVTGVQRVLFRSRFGGRMAASALITLREGLEAALIVGIILAYLARTGHRGKFAVAWVGTGLAILMSAIVGAGIFVTAGEFTGRGEQLFEGTAMFTAAGVLTYMIFGMRRQSITIPAHLHARRTTALQAGPLPP